MLNGLLSEQGKEALKETGYHIEKLRSFLEGCLPPNSLTDETQDFLQLLEKNPVFHLLMN